MTIAEFLEARIDEDETTPRTEKVSAECAAKRMIIAQWYAATEDGDDDSVNEIASGIIIALRDVLRALASVYGNHPDYIPEWNTYGG